MSDRDPLQTIWQSQSHEGFSMSLTDIHARAEHFQARIRTRNWIEYVAGALVVACFAWLALTVPEPIVQTGAVLTACGALYVCWQLHRIGRAATRAEKNAGAQSWATFHRGELSRQRDALRTVWRWYLAPFAPGMLVFLAGVSFTAANPAPLPARLGVFVAGITIMAALFAAIAWLNAQAVKRLDAELAALDRVDSE